MSFFWTLAHASVNLRFLRYLLEPGTQDSKQSGPRRYNPSDFTTAFVYYDCVLTIGIELAMSRRLQCFSWDVIDKAQPPGTLYFLFAIAIYQIL